MRRIRQLEEELAVSRSTELSTRDQLQTALSARSEIEMELKEERQHVFELRGRVERFENMKGATKELTRQNKALETRIQVLEGSIKQKRIQMEETLAMQQAEAADQASKMRANLDKVLKERDAALQRVHQTEGEATCGMQARLAESAGRCDQQLAERRGEALRHIVNLLEDKEISSTDLQSDDGANDDNNGRDDISDRALPALQAFCTAVCDAQAAWEGEREALMHQLQVVSEEYQNLQAKPSSLLAHEVSTNAAQREELCQKSIVEKGAEQETLQLRLQMQALEAAVEQHKKEAAEAQEEARHLRATAESRDQRTKEMRAAVAEAVQQSEALYDSVQKAIHSAKKQLSEIVTTTAITTTDSLQSENARDDPLASALVDRALIAIDALVLVAQGTDAKTTNIGECIGQALESLSKGYSEMFGIIFERRRMYAALTAARTSIFDFDSDSSGQSQRVVQAETTTVAPCSSQNGSNLALEVLLDDFLGYISAMVHDMHVEKVSTEHELEHLKKAHGELHQHAHALQRVLLIADRGDALVELADAQRKVEGLEMLCRDLMHRSQSLQQAADDAQAEAAKNWSDVKGDVAQLVQHAERAEMDAETAMQKQRAECARQVDEAQAREHAACAARSAAESECSKLRKELSIAAQQLQEARADASTAVTRAAAAEEMLRCMELPATKNGQKDCFSSAGSGQCSRPEEDEEPAKEELHAQEVSRLESRIVILEEQLGCIRAERDAAIRQVAATESVATQHLAACKASSSRLQQQAEADVAAAENRASALELEVLSLKTQLEAGSLSYRAETKEPKSDRGHEPCQEQAVVQDLTYSPLPATRDASVLQRRLDAAMSHIESLRLLNHNLEEQLATALVMHGREGQTAGRDHPLKTPAPDHQNNAQTLEAETRLSSSLEKVVSMWKEACTSRDARLQDAEGKLRTALGQAAQHTAELTALKTTLQASNAEVEASQQLIHELRMRLDEVLRTHDVLKRQAEAGDAAQASAKRARAALTAVERQLNETKVQHSASQSRIFELERALEESRVAADRLNEHLRLLEGYEGRARASEERALAAEAALAKHLDSSSSAEATSLGKQLQEAWETQSHLAGRVQELRKELAEVRGEAAAARRDANAEAARCSALQAQLSEAIGALEEQGAALEALQSALMISRDVF